VTITVPAIPTGGVIRDCHDGQPSLTETASRVFAAISDGTVPLPHAVRFSEPLRRVSVEIDFLDDLFTWAAWLDADVKSDPTGTPCVRHFEASDGQVVVYCIHDSSAA
jgi:hypothetical protein